MSKQRREQSQDSIFVDNPFVDGFLEWMGSREGRQCIEVRDVLWGLLEDVELDAKQRQLIWPDAERLDLVQSIQRIQKLQAGNQPNHCQPSRADHPGKRLHLTNSSGTGRVLFRHADHVVRDNAK